MATYRGHIQNGAVVLDDPIDLPDGTEVKVDAMKDEDEDELKSLHPELRKFLGILPKDLDLRKEYYEGMLRKHQ